LPGAEFPLPQITSELKDSDGPLGCAPSLPADCLLRARLHVLDALAREPLDAGRIIKHLDRDPAAVVDLAEGLEDRYEIDLAESWPELVRVVGVKMNEPRGAAANDLWNRRRFARHGLA